MIGWLTVERGRWSTAALSRHVQRDPYIFQPLLAAPRSTGRASIATVGCLAGHSSFRRLNPRQARWPAYRPIPGIEILDRVFHQGFIDPSSAIPIAVNQILTMSCGRQW